MSRVSDAANRRPTISFVLAPEEFRLLAELAGRRGRDPHDFAKSMVRTGVHLLHLGTQETASSSLDRRLDEVIRLVTEQAAIGQTSGAGHARAAGDRTRGSRRASGASAGSQPASSHGIQPRLHDEIVDVLRTSGVPMSASDIADAIHRRGRYRGRRSAKPMSGAAISSRVSNPYYRDLFQRSKRKIALADSTGEAVHRDQD